MVDGPGTFRAIRANILDVDDDGDGDLLLQAGGVAGGSGPEGIHLLRNDSGTFSRPWGHTSGTSPRGWALGNVDTDGDVDFVVFDNGADLRLYRDEGALPATTPASLGTTSGLGSLSFALGDVDGDGDLDLAIARTGAADEIWYGDGAGGFSPGWSSIEIEDHHYAAWIDWDGDGAADDLAVASQAAPLRIYQRVCR